MNSYSVKETSIKLGISERVVQKRCKHHKFRKKDNKYFITDDNIDVLRTDLRTPNEPNERTTQKSSQLDVEVESLKIEIESLKNQLSEYDIAENETIQVFTFDEYNLFEQRLSEWKSQRIEIEHQEQLFNAEQKSSTELIDHYKSQFLYQRKQNEKVLEMHQKLLDIIGEQNKIQIQKNVIEAADKEIIKKDTWRTKE